MSPSPGSAWVLRTDEGTAGPRVAVKDLIDVAGLPTTAGSRYVADGAVAAEADAACLSGLRLALGEGRARLAGKAALHELALGVTGINPWFSTPRNPMGAGLVPGGSSSGSAAAVASGEADWAIGTDTGGSVRIPAACCGVTGLKTTGGRIPLGGVWPLSPSLDTVGPIARDAAGVAAGMAVLDPGFDLDAALGPWGGGTIGRVRPDLAVDAGVDHAVDAALAALGAPVVAVGLPGWGRATTAGLDILGSEAAALHGAMVAAHPRRFGADVVAALSHAAGVGRQRLRDARAYATRWRAELDEALGTVDVLALATIGIPVPPVADPRGLGVAWTLPVNLAGLPAVAVPVPARSGPPASLQLIGPAGGEELLCRVAAAVSQATVLR